MTNQESKEVGQDVHNQIASLVCTHFNNLPKKGKPLHNEWTTLAAIVQSKSLTSNSENNLIVVSCASGTKCLGSTELSPLGDIISDSHAEVLARRSFMMYLFDQLQHCASGSTNSIFYNVPASTSSAFPQYKLIEGLGFHLFVSQLPCGDASIILEDKDDDLPNVENSEDDVQVRPKKPKLDVMCNRTGAKLQVGPLIYEDIQSVGKCRIKPGKGPPTFCMSCSDKIAKWQILGLQGCLLSNVISIPIRFSSITIGADVPFNASSLERAVTRRFIGKLYNLKESDVNLKDVLQDYYIPSFAQSVVNFSNYFDSSLMIRKNPSPASIIWHLSINNDLNIVQVIVNGRKQGVTKKNFGKPSAAVDICRKNIFKKLLDLIDLKPSDNLEPIKCLNYMKAKEMNQRYRVCWTTLKTNVLKGWTEKPDDMQKFGM